MALHFRAGAVRGRAIGTRGGTPEKEVEHVDNIAVSKAALVRTASAGV